MSAKLINLLIPSEITLLQQDILAKATLLDRDDFEKVRDQFFKDNPSVAQYPKMEEVAQTIFDALRDEMVTFCMQDDLYKKNIESLTAILKPLTNLSEKGKEIISALAGRLRDYLCITNLATIVERSIEKWRDLSPHSIDFHTGSDHYQQRKTDNSALRQFLYTSCM